MVVDVDSRGAMDAIVAACGLIGAGCYASMMVPQILLNRSRQSTAGLSLGFVLMWHAASVLIIAYGRAQQQSPWVLLSMVSFAATCAVLEAQVFAYSRRQTRWLWPIAFALSALSVALGFALGEVLRISPHAVVLSLGSVAPAALFGLAFFPQFYEFIHTRSYEGYSFLVSAIDVLGSAANTVVIVAEEGCTASALASSAPFVTLILLHAVLLCIAASIYATQGTPRALEAGAEPKGSAPPDGGGDAAMVVSNKPLLAGRPA